MTRILLLSIRFLDDRTRSDRQWGETIMARRIFGCSCIGLPAMPRETMPVNMASDGLPCSHRREEQCGAMATTCDPLFAALRWCESLDAPYIIAPQARAGRVLLTYVLNNMSDSNPNSRTPKMIRPTILNGDRLLQYVWIFEETTACATTHAQVIVEAARHIHCLGWGIDLAVGCGEIIEKMPHVTAPRLPYRPTDLVAVAESIYVSQHSEASSRRTTLCRFTERYESPG